MAKYDTGNDGTKCFGDRFSKVDHAVGEGHDQDGLVSKALVQGKEQESSKEAFKSGKLCTIGKFIDDEVYKALICALVEGVLLHEVRLRTGPKEEGEHDAIHAKVDLGVAFFPESEAIVRKFFFQNKTYGKRGDEQANCDAYQCPVDKGKEFFVGVGCDPEGRFYKRGKFVIIEVGASIVVVKCEENGRKNESNPAMDHGGLLGCVFKVSLESLKLSRKPGAQDEILCV